MNEPRGLGRVAAVAGVAILLMAVIYGASTTRQSAAVLHDERAPRADEALLRFVNAHPLPVRVTIATADGETRELWPVGPGSDHVLVPGGADATTITVTSHSFEVEAAHSGTHRFTADADRSEAVVVDRSGQAAVEPHDEPARAGHHGIVVRGPLDPPARAWAWTAADRANRPVFSNETGETWSVQSAFVPKADVTISWEVAGPLHTRSEELVFEAGSAHEIIVDRDGRWSHRQPGALRAWWMRR